MTETALPPAQPMGLFARILGVITSPKSTYQSIIAVPKPFGVLFVVALVMGVFSAIPLFTEAGREAVVQMQLKAMAARGNAPSPESEASLRSFSAYFGYVTLASTFIILPVMTLFITALYWALFNVVLGGTASFKQVLAVVAHANVIPALGLVAGLYFMRREPTMSMGGPFNFGALMPGLEEGSALAKFLGNLSLFGLWGVFVNAIGLGVLYRRKTAGIFVVLLIVYLAFTYLGGMFRG